MQVFRGRLADFANGIQPISVPFGQAPETRMNAGTRGPISARDFCTLSAGRRLLLREPEDGRGTVAQPERGRAGEAGARRAEREALRGDEREADAGEVR